MFVYYADVLAVAMHKAICVFILYIGMSLHLLGHFNESFVANGSDGIVRVGDSCLRREGSGFMIIRDLYRVAV